MSHYFFTIFLCIIQTRLYSLFTTQYLKKLCIFASTLALIFTNKLHPNIQLVTLWLSYFLHCLDCTPSPTNCKTSQFLEKQDPQASKFKTTFFFYQILWPNMKITKDLSPYQIHFDKAAPINIVLFPIPSKPIKSYTNTLISTLSTKKTSSNINLYH